MYRIVLILRHCIAEHYVELVGVELYRFTLTGFYACTALQVLQRIVFYCIALIVLYCITLDLILYFVAALYRIAQYCPVMP